MIRYPSLRVIALSLVAFWALAGFGVGRLLGGLVDGPR